jgi:hypothetical protein
VKTLSVEMMKTIDTLFPFHQQEKLQFIDSTIAKEKLGSRRPTPFLDDPKHSISRVYHTSHVRLHSVTCTNPRPARQTALPQSRCRNTPCVVQSPTYKN